MNVSDVIQNLVDKLIAEKEKNFMLQQQLQNQLQQAENQKMSKD